MKIETHLQDVEDYEKTLTYLQMQDLVIARKLIVEGCVLAATNILNLALHQCGKSPEEKDIKIKVMEDVK